MFADRSLALLRRIAAEAVRVDADPGASLAGVARVVAELLGARLVALFLLDEDSLILQPGAVGIELQLADRLSSIPCGPGDGWLESWVVFSAQSYLAGSAGVDAGAGPSRLEVAGIRKPVMVPLAAGGAALGLLLVAEPVEESGFSKADLPALETAGCAAAMLIEQQRLLRGLVLSKEAVADRAERVAQRMGELEQLKAHILNLAAHELRGPLAVIRGYLSMITDQTLDADATRRVLPILNAKVTQMDALVTQMLEVARLEEGRLEVNWAVVDIGAIAREVVDVEALLAPPGLTVFLERPRDTILVRGDGIRIATILSNLLDNAIKYSPGGGAVRCRLSVEGGSASVSVADQGLGIAETDLPRLFSKFGRIVTTDNSHILGTGLGLHLSRELAHLQDGEITVESVEGEGSVFTLQLPVLAQPSQEDTSPTTN